MSRMKCIVCFMIGIYLGCILLNKIQKMFPAHFDDHEQSCSFDDQPIYHSLARDVDHYESSDLPSPSYTLRILCWIMTNPDNHVKRAQHVKHTWGKRCTTLLFMSSERNDELPTISLNVSEGRNQLWSKTRAAFQYIYKHHKGEYDWVIKADDDTYVVMENMVKLLSSYNPLEALYLGCKLGIYVPQGYMQGGAYVLSAAAVEKLVVIAFNKLKCQEYSTDPEDIEMGYCLELIGVEAVDTRDSFGREMFIPDVLENHFLFKETFWFKQRSFYSALPGMNCCADYPVSFHYVKPYKMYILEYLIYHVNPVAKANSRN